MTTATMCYPAQDVFYLCSFNKQVIKTTLSHAIRPACASDYYEGFLDLSCLLMDTDTPI